jgi:hypothetical protein
MVKMVALKSFVYAGKRLQPGAEFEARTGSDARLLKAIKNAGEAPPEPPPAPAPAVRAYRRRDVPAEVPLALPPAADPIADPAPADKPKRTYKRRDLVAE